MSPDSISHWYEAETMVFSNASPYLYSLIMAGLLRIWETPAIVGLLQIITLVTIVSLFLNYAYKKGINRKILIVIALIFAAYPIFGIYNVTIWKDVLYSYVILGAMLLMAALMTDKKMRDSTYWYWTLAVLTALIPLLRFNGIIFFVFIPLLLFVFKGINIKRLIYFFTIQLSVYFFFSVILLGLLNVTQAPLMKEGIYVKLVGAIYHEKKPALTDGEKKIFTAIMPEATWKKYYQCISVDPLFYIGIPENRSIDYSKEIDPDPNFVSRWHRAVFSASLRNPSAVINDKVCMASYLLGAKDILYKYEGSIYLADNGNGPIKYDSKFPLGKRALYKYLNLTSSNTSHGYGVGTGVLAKIVNFLIWSAVIPTLLFSFYGFLAFKFRLKALGSYVILMFLNIFMVIVIVPAASLRYMYALFVTAPFLPLIYLIERKKSLKK